MSIQSPATTAGESQLAVMSRLETGDRLSQAEFERRSRTSRSPTMSPTTWALRLRRCAVPRFSCLDRIYGNDS
jgi:hypothetical protein